MPDAAASGNDTGDKAPKPAHSAYTLTRAAQNLNSGIFP
jgi:hypothetical protein